MYVGTPRTAFDTLMHLPLEQVHEFGHASTQLRALLAAREGALVNAYRGAAPLQWVADGLPTEEPPATANLITIVSPLGTYLHHQPGTDKIIESGSNKNTKAKMMANCLIEAAYFSDELTILDEVQLGGTVTSLAKYCARKAPEYGLKLPLHVITGEDTNPQVVASRIGTYKQMVAGSRPGVKLTPVAMPLIATDRAALLPEIHYTGPQKGQNEDENLANFKLAENPEAEFLIRLVGTMARKPEFAQDTRHLQTLLGDLSRDASTQMMHDWVSALSDKFTY